MSTDTVTVTVRLPRDTCRMLDRIAAVAGVSPETVIKVALAGRVVAEEQQPALTPWFDRYTKPARPGVYEREMRIDNFSYWDGARWSMSAQHPITAFMNRRMKSQLQAVRWRGLAAEPTP